MIVKINVSNLTLRINIMNTVNLAALSICLIFSSCSAFAVNADHGRFSLKPGVINRVPTKPMCNTTRTDKKSLLAQKRCVALARGGR
jgi:hypothetical protein